MNGPPGPVAKESAGGGETAAVAQPSRELPAHLPLEQKDLPAPRKKNIEANVHPKKNIKLGTALDRHEEIKTTAQAGPMQSDSPGNPDSPSQGSGRLPGLAQALRFIPAMVRPEEPGMALAARAHWRELLGLRMVPVSCAK